MKLKESVNLGEFIPVEVCFEERKPVYLLATNLDKARERLKSLNVNFLECKEVNITKLPNTDLLRPAIAYTKFYAGSKKKEKHQNLDETYFVQTGFTKGSVKPKPF